MSPLTLDQALSLALEHFNAARFQQAETITRQILAAHRPHPGAAGT